MIKVGTCKCGEELATSGLNYDHDNFEGDIVCRQCQRCYHWEMKMGVVKLGRCRKIFRSKPEISPAPYVLGQGVVGYKMS